MLKGVEIGMGKWNPNWIKIYDSKVLVFKVISPYRKHFISNGWGEKHIRNCLYTAETFQNKEIFYALSRELSWTHTQRPLIQEAYLLIILRHNYSDLSDN